MVEYRIVDRERGGFWVEMTDRRNGRTKQTRFLVARNPDGRMGLLAVEAPNPESGRIQPIPHRIVPAIEQRMRSVLDLFAPTSEPDAPRAEARAPAGVFPEAEQIEREMVLGEQTVEVDILRHPAVPIMGVVRYADQNEHHRFELMAFGLSGARSRDAR